MHIITWVCPPCSSVSQIIISHAQFQKHFSVQEFQLKSVSFEVFFSTIGFLLLFSSLWNFFISLASLASCLEKRHLCCFLSSSFVKRRFSRREHLLHISTIEESRKHSSKRHLFRTPPLAGAYLLLPPTQKMRAYFSAKTQSTTQGAETFLEKG